MAGRDAGGAAGLALIALFALVHSASLEVGTVSRPGPGFFPLLLAAALTVVCAALLLGAWRDHRADRWGPAERRALPDAPATETTRPPRRWALLATVVALAIYVAVFESAGFVLSTIGLLAFLFAALARYRWPIALGAAVVIAFAARLVFDTWLQVRLPPGLWGR